jgi:hypothetical protein
MIAIITSVDFADLLALTLPLNKKHFKSILVVTSPNDKETLEVALEHDCSVHITDAFYRNGAMFNKYRAVEEGLTVFGRAAASHDDGWLCVQDADIVWPSLAPRSLFQQGYLYTPHRRMLSQLTTKLPPENEWHVLPYYRNIKEWCGYCHMFHISDPYLGQPPWYEIDWKHAGGADTYFQLKWPNAFKQRPSWTVLHIGPNGVNWCGRTSPRLDGTPIPDAEGRLASLHKMIRGRRGLASDPYRHERIVKPMIE